MPLLRSSGAYEKLPKREVFTLSVTKYRPVSEEQAHSGHTRNGDSEQTAVQILSVFRRRCRLVAFITL